MKHQTIEPKTQPAPDTAQDELSLDELDQVIGGGILVPGKTLQGDNSGGMSRSINFSKQEQARGIIAV